ncbi:hypothetical protein [Pseudoalteromonas rubra]|uniref:Uncharacterized protein n=1 Tax=Pseudoalteromonas rubra TaxID=43658 RepID=A0A0U3IDF3_9GAMM|nr:hypothetical protein [Pseudoalteromonas rubra]ALU46127.1 hypothetical protein AT705_24505 [Pseudoalteromonas rubra]
MKSSQTSKSTLSTVLTELVLLASLVGTLPNLLIDGLKDLFGPCGFTPSVCEQTEFMGMIQLVCFVVVNIIVYIIAKVISGELKAKKK